MTDKAIFVGLLCCCVAWIAGCSTGGKAPSQSEEPQKNSSQVLAEAQQLIDRLKGKTIEEKVDPMDGTKTFYLSLSPSTGDGILVVRCSSPKKLQAYVSFPDMVDSSDGRSAVRLKFDQSQPFKEFWRESKDYEALVTPNATIFLKQLAASETFMFEHSKFHGGTEVTTFNLSDFHEGLAKLTRACQFSLPSS